ncbi:MAG: NAD(P)/FAD-dependent oxidoreductase, partial [Acidimicrobiia bacterium]|nr:NAD(P)/FAD-dependent oxidoreductase [Acidimicrobiia bacterium]
MPPPTPRVVVVGAGIGGIATGVNLKRAGVDTFTIFEASLGIGGTWWDNTYPGAEVDVGSHLYCFSFKPHHWTRTHARQPELQKYLEETVDQFGLRPHLRLGVTVESAAWDDDRNVWSLTLDDGTVDECNVLISAVGFLNVPRYPDWPGLADFRGPKFHTARWEHEHDLSGKVVAVVGTGSSATQVVPAIQPLVEHLYLFQRQPGWVLPKGERDFTDEERALLSVRWRGLRERWRQRWMLEKSLWNGHLWRPGTTANAEREAVCRRYIDRVFKDRPDLRDAVTPTYPYPGKRPVVASTFYPALKKDNVTLVPKAVASVTPTGIVDVDGVERPVDILVMATGFQAADYLTRLRVVGRRGRTLQEQWAGEPRAYLGITVPEFPNFFMLYGPGTNGGELVMTLESQAEYAVRAVKRMMRTGATAVEVRPIFEAAWWRWLQSRMEGTSWTMTDNYFKGPTGKVVTQFPY